MAAVRAVTAIATVPRFLAALLILLSFSCTTEPPPAPPRYLPFAEAQEIVPFPILVPTFVSEGWELDTEVHILEGQWYGNEVKGASYFLLQFEPWRKKQIHIRQFVAEGTFPEMRTLPDIVTYEVIDVDGIALEIKEADMGGGITTSVEWETEHEGKRLFFSVISEVSRQETLDMVRSMKPLGE